MSTLFMYGVTGSGETCSANIIQLKAPEELFDLGGTGATAELIANELIGKRCLDLLVGEGEELSGHIIPSMLIGGRGVVWPHHPVDADWWERSCLACFWNSARCRLRNKKAVQGNWRSLLLVQPKAPQ